MMTWEELLDQVSCGTLDPQGQEMVMMLLRDNKQFRAALVTHDLIARNHGKHKQPGGAYYVASRRTLSSPSYCEAAYQRYRHILES